MTRRTANSIALAISLAALAALPISSPRALEGPAFPPVLPAGTPVPGLIVGEVTWNVSGSPYVVAQDVSVDAAATLTILAGVEVRFEGVWTFATDGLLRVRGEAGNPVTFRQNRTDVTIQFLVESRSGGSMSFVQAVMDNGALLVMGMTSRLAVDGLAVRCTVAGCGNAVHLQDVSDVTMRGVTIDYAATPAGTWGVAASGPRLVLDGFSISGTYGGISASRCNMCFIANGTLARLSNTTYGVYLEGNDSAIFRLRFPSGSSWQVHAEGDRNVLRGNRLKYARTSAISAGGDGILIEGNDIVGPGEGISVFRTNDATVRNNRVSNARWRGIIVTHGAQPAWGSSVLGNYVQDSGWGILSEQTQGTIRGNVIRGNDVGIELREGSNQVDHNHFEFNTIQARDTTPGNSWDDGYPSGGNWWSDYAGDDLFSGPLQDVPGPDGIGDVPYVINAFARDRYPFYSAPAPGVPQEFTAEAQPGGVVRLTWRASPMADSYYLYTARTPTGFDFASPIRLPNVTEWMDFGAALPGPHYYVLRARNTTVDRTGPTSNTAGAWTHLLPPGRSTLSLPFTPYPWVEYTTPGWTDTVGEILAATGAASFAYMESGQWRYVPGDGDPNRTLRIGEGYVMESPTAPSITFTGLPAAMIDYATWPPYPLVGFDPASTARYVSATAIGDDIVLTWTQLAEIPPGNGFYEVYASPSPAGLRGYPTVDHERIATVPATAAATLSYTHVGAVRVHAAWYYLIVPVRAAYLRGGSTYSVGVVALDLPSGYTAIGLPVQPYANGTYVSRNFSSLLSGPEFRGAMWFDPARGDWVAHAAWMPPGTYDAPFTMVMAMQIDATVRTRIVFAGV